MKELQPVIQNRRPLANEGKKQEKNGIWIEKEMNGITPERQGVMRHKGQIIAFDDLAENSGIFQLLVKYKRLCTYMSDIGCFELWSDCLVLFVVVYGLSIYWNLKAFLFFNVVICAFHLVSYCFWFLFLIWIGVFELFPYDLSFCCVLACWFAIGFWVVVITEKVSLARCFLLA